MKTITVAELRQNPTAALEEVAAGETYVVTRHRRPVARLVPPDEVELVPLTATRPAGPSRLAADSPWQLQTADSVDELTADMASSW